jgi:hypothetical protein
VIDKLTAAGIFDWPLLLDCESRGHAAGRLGCEPGPAVSALRFLHGTIEDWTPGTQHPEPREVRVELICRGHTIWFRSRMRNHVQCTICGKQCTLNGWVSIVGIP